MFIGCIDIFKQDEIFIKLCLGSIVFIKLSPGSALGHEVSIASVSCVFVCFLHIRTSVYNCKSNTQLVLVLLSTGHKALSQIPCQLWKNSSLLAYPSRSK